MEKLKPLFTAREEWQGRGYIAQVFNSDDLLDLDIGPIKQIQAVCFSNKDNIVLYKHIKGWNGLPGGSIEAQETLESALKRELLEEVAVKLEDWSIIGYEKIWWEDMPENIFYFLRCWAKVKLIDQPHKDPDGKSLGRLIVKTQEAHKKLGYGKKGEIWLDLAIRKFKENYPG